MSGRAGDPSGAPSGKSPCASAYSACRPASTSTSRRPPEATTSGAGDRTSNDSTWPSSGRWGTGPARATRTASSRRSSPVGTTLPSCSTERTSPSRPTCSTRLACPSVTRKPSPYASIAYGTPVGTKKSKSGGGGFSDVHAPMSATTSQVSSSSTRKTPVTALPPTSSLTIEVRAYIVEPRNATSMAPPASPTSTCGGRHEATTVVAPLSGSIRETSPETGSGTYSAPSGPTALPDPPSRPETTTCGPLASRPPSSACAPAGTASNATVPAVSSSGARRRWCIVDPSPAPSTGRHRGCRDHPGHRDAALGGPATRLSGRHGTDRSGRRALPGLLAPPTAGKGSPRRSGGLTGPHDRSPRGCVPSPTVDRRQQVSAARRRRRR